MLGGLFKRKQKMNVDAMRRELIRILLKRRVRNDKQAAAQGITEATVDGFTVEQLATFPEATIVMTVETYATLRSQGVPEQQIFELIEQHRAQLGTGKLPEHLTLNSYVQYRVALEVANVPGAATVDPSHVSECVAVSQQMYGLK